MTLSEIVNAVMGDAGFRNQVSEQNILLYIDQIQKAAFDHDSPAFLEWGATLTINDGKGPYDWPTNARRVVGVTTWEDSSIIGNPEAMRSMFQDCRISYFGRQYLFINEPNTESVYRWVYYIRPETIADKDTDDDKVLIPEEWHWNLLVQGTLALCSSEQAGTMSTRDRLAPYLQPFWDSIDSANVGDDVSVSAGSWSDFPEGVD